MFTVPPVDVLSVLSVFSIRFLFLRNVFFFFFLINHKDTRVRPNNVLVISVLFIFMIFVVHEHLLNILYIKNTFMDSKCTIKEISNDCSYKVFQKF